MREIKFRAYLKQEKEMREVFSFCDKFIKVIVGMGTAWKLQISDFEPIMQFTGLKDKNGVDIYEGDILDTGWEISFKDGMFGIFDNNHYMGFNTYMSQHREVIGNIYENPKLL